ncbi:DUF4177 domain-containing protein [Clostridium fungisolvens]|uniref:DUF4177 domain-containing protein n=1 Tax=Clostridium fungisolvens TaxID=1604897 RepID=A0A6V8SI49_9CLOT|nr:DUF4177 domain-containing protein [Clostridium fungisolvens]GFP76262.1 hypothetical protein bsdtw1_02363 [Clostridium fungisolvens]
MYKYEFVRIELKKFSLKELKPKQDHHAIIEQYAKAGWRLVQILTPPTGIYGSATHYELIFEKEV